MTGGEAQRIDTSRIAVYLMTGEYDWGNSPDQTRILAEQIKGSKFVEMKGLGHFPMAENFRGVQKVSDVDTGRDCDEFGKVMASPLRVERIGINILRLH